MLQPEANAEIKSRIVAFEQKLQARMAEVFCPVHLSLGQESVAVDLHGCLGPDDYLFSTHRNHHHYLAKGGDEQKLWDEIMGLESGINGGFSGSQSYSDPSVNFHSSAIVAGLVGVATGVAYALKMNGSKAVVVCCIGDAGTEQGVFWESLNFAAVNKLPIAYICENNGMSVDSPIEERQARSIAVKASAFGVSVWSSVKSAVGCARSGWPAFHEAKVKLECDHINFALMMPKEVM